MNVCNCVGGDPNNCNACNPWPHRRTMGNTYYQWPYYQPQPYAKQGWMCPNCGKVHAPWVASCTCHNNQYPVTVNSTSDVVKVHYQSTSNLDLSKPNLPTNQI